MARCSLSLQRLHLCAAALDAALLQDRRLLLFERVEFVEEARGGKAQRGGGLAGGPHIDQPVQRVFALLDALFVADRAGLGALGAAEALALVADDRLDRREQLGRGHQAHRHAGAAEDRFDDFAVVEVGDDDAVLDRVAADDAAGRHLQVEDRDRRWRRAGAPASWSACRGRRCPRRVSSRITMQLPLMRGSSELTAAVTKLAKAMLVMKRPRLSTCSMGSSPSFHSATRTLPLSMPVSTPT